MAFPLTHRFGGLVKQDLARNTAVPGAVAPEALLFNHHGFGPEAGRNPGGRKPGGTTAKYNHVKVIAHWESIIRVLFLIFFRTVR